MDTAGSVTESLSEMLGLSRRTLLKLAGLAVGGAVVDSLVSGCQLTPEQKAKIAARPTRRSITTLAATDPVVKNFEKAVGLMKARPSSDKRSYQAQVDIHQQAPHGTWLFLPWHRAYLYYFEEICRELLADDTFALPYWNWTAAPDVPAVFRDSTSSLFNTTRTQYIPASSWVFQQSNIDSILGQTNFEIFASAPVGLNDFTSNFTGATMGPLEGGPHNAGHNLVGSWRDGVDLALVPVSPRDPIFWTHHGRVDELWVEWNFNRLNGNTSKTDWTTTVFSGFFYDRKGNPASMSVTETVLLPYYHYQYDTQRNWLAP